MFKVRKAAYLEKCSACQAEAEGLLEIDKFNFCHDCGQPMVERKGFDQPYCSYCSKSVNPTWVYCPFCGHSGNGQTG